MFCKVHSGRNRHESWLNGVVHAGVLPLWVKNRIILASRNMNYIEISQLIGSVQLLRRRGELTVFTVFILVPTTVWDTGHPII